MNELSKRDASLRIIGDVGSPMFPPELRSYTERTVFGKGSMKVNLLINYSWQWDLMDRAKKKSGKSNFMESLGSGDVSRIDLIIRWGGHNRLSGFLPIQSVYADIFIVKDLWPDFNAQQVKDALDWYQTQDVTLGG